MRGRDHLTREMVLMEASLAVAAARERKIIPPFLDEARQILANFPGCGISDADLATEMERVFSSRGPAEPCN